MCYLSRNVLWVNKNICVMTTLLFISVCTTKRMSHYKVIFKRFGVFMANNYIVIFWFTALVSDFQHYRGTRCLSLLYDDGFPPRHW
jgi:hypothetical protein